MDRQTSLERARQVFLSPRTLEEDSRFAATLTRLTQTGLQWGGLLGIAGVTVLVLVHAGLLGRPTAWWYPASFSSDIFVLWDKAVVVAVCAGAIALGRAKCRLTVGRWAGIGLALAIATVSLTHDAFRGILSVEYLILVYLLAVAVVPYRPWQAALLGIALSLLFYGLGHYGLPGTRAAFPDLVKPGHLVRMGFATVVLSGVAALLHSTRYQQHEARQEAEELHEQVATLERAKSRFFADVSHEFRTPLTIVLGSLEEARAGRLGDVPEALKARLEQMAKQGRRMERLVNQLLELSTLDEGRLQLSVEEIDLAAFTQRTVPPFRQWADDEELSLQLDLPSDPCPVWVDPNRVEDVIANLLSNAIKYTPTEGTVRVRVDNADGRVSLSVRDTGPGIPDELQARVFERQTSQLPVGDDPDDDTPRYADGNHWIGMGIGLAHTRALVQRHGGQLDVDSEPGFGTEITVHFPKGTDHIRDDDRVEEAPDDASPTHRSVDGASGRTSSTDDTDAPSPPEDAPHILVVDDQAEMRQYLRRLFGGSYHVETAGSGADALDRLRNERPDLVISDVVMPEMDGIRLCRTIRDDEELRSLPVILLTGREESDVKRSGLEAGADAYVSKPFDPAELEARIENLIEIRRIVQAQVRVPDWMEPKETTVSSEDADFLEALNKTVNEHIANSNFGVDWLADEMDLSTRHLRRRIKEVTRLSPAGFIRTRRLQHAAALLQDGADNISDVASAVGYRDASYFSRLFRETFGCPPGEYSERQHEPPENPDTSA